MKKFTGFIVLILGTIGGYYLYQKQVKKKISPYILYAQEIPGTYRIGFTNLDKEVRIDQLPVIGTIPAWISGKLFRNGPARFSCGDSWVDWFDGLAMVHAFTIDNGRVSYANKFLRTSNYQEVQKTGKMSYGGFAQDPCRTIFQRIAGYFQPIKSKFPEIPNANVNIAHYGDNFVALTEIPLPVEFDPETLETLGVLNYQDALPKSAIHDTPHPHYDPVHKEHLIYFTKFGRVSSHNICRIKDGSVKREIIATIDIEQPSYMHSFAITEKYAILAALPLVVNPLDLILKQQAFIKNFVWKPELGTKFMVVDRLKNKLVGIYRAEPFFAFHNVNAFEEFGQIVLDIVTYPNAAGIGKAKISELLAPFTAYAQLDSTQMGRELDADILEAGTLKRFTIDINSGAVHSRKLAAERIELPRINYENYNGKNYTYVYAYSKSHREPYYVADKLVKLNIKNSTQLEWKQEKCYPGEPVFLGRPGAKQEDDGVVLSVVLDAKRATSFLLILDGKSFTEIARAEVPHHIPFGIHGQFFKR